MCNCIFFNSIQCSWIVKTSCLYINCKCSIASYLQYLVLAFGEREEGLPVHREQEETSLTTLVQVWNVGLKVAAGKYTNTSAIYILYTSSSNPVKKIYQYISNSRTIPSIIPNICLTIFIVQKIFQRETLFFLFDKFFPTEYIYLNHIQILDDSYLESNLGRQMGIQDSAALNDSEELTRLIIKWRSIGWRKYFFILTSVTSWLLARIRAKTRSCKTNILCCHV